MGNFYSTLPLKNLTAQGAYKSDMNNHNITTRTHTQSFMDYMLPIYTYQKAENQTVGVSFALSLSLSLPLSIPHSPYPLTYRCWSHAVSQREKEGEQLNIHKEVLRVWFID